MVYLRESFSLEESDAILKRVLGGHSIARTYRGKPILCKQVEMPRDLFLRQPYLDAKTWNINRNRLGEVGMLLKSSLSLLYGLPKELGSSSRRLL